MFIEGARSFVLVRNADKEVVAERGLDYGDNERALISELPAASYEIVSYLQGCSGSCQSLDPPTERCARTVSVRPAERTRVKVTAQGDRPCRIKVIIPWSQVRVNCGELRRPGCLVAAKRLRKLFDTRNDHKSVAAVAVRRGGYTVTFDDGTAISGDAARSEV
ncbi:MAG: hypothetical protein H0X16_09565 [Chloroflexi bacterium]|nr:hypothetical protein [Chloroflexota bacterium]